MPRKWCDLDVSEVFACVFLMLYIYSLIYVFFVIEIQWNLFISLAAFSVLPLKLIIVLVKYQKISFSIFHQEWKVLKVIRELN